MQECSSTGSSLGTMYYFMTRSRYICINIYVLRSRTTSANNVPRPFAFYVCSCSTSVRTLVNIRPNDFRSLFISEKKRTRKEHEHPRRKIRSRCSLPARSIYTCHPGSKTLRQHYLAYTHAECVTLY